MVNLMATRALDTKPATDPVLQAKIDLAAALRLAVMHDLDEGIDNHFTAMVPGHEDRFMMLPFGYHWSEACASNMIEFDEQGNTLAGDGIVEITAQSIHAPLHRISGRKVIMHTHQPWATALNSLQNNRLVPHNQTASLLHGYIAYDDTYTGLAYSLEEGERLAEIIGKKPVLFLKNHGVVVASNSIAQGYKLLYLIERACRTQILAMSTGEPLNVIADDVIAKVQGPNEADRHSGQRHILYFEAMKRILDRDMPGYDE